MSANSEQKGYMQVKRIESHIGPQGKELLRQWSKVRLNSYLKCRNKFHKTILSSNNFFSMPEQNILQHLCTFISKDCPEEV